MSEAFAERGAPPSPDGVRTVDDLAARLQALQAWSGMSYRALHREVVRSRRERRIAELPAFDTVHRCMQPGRTRVDVDLVVDVAAALLGARDPAASWRQAHQVVVRTVTEASLVTVSDTLPSDEPGFTGRRAELACILDVVRRSGGAVVAITGMGGVGKTRLAVRAAHRLAASEPAPDVELCVDLRGYDTNLPPVDPAAVLDGFLRRLGVPGSQLPQLDLDARRAKFQELLTGRSALLLLDNAASAEQVRPLLPDLGSCKVLITSRRELPGVGTTQVALDVFGPTEATVALRDAAAPSPVDPRSDDAARIVGLVGHLPLAIALVGARIRGAAGWTLADHVERLTEARESQQLEAGVELALRLSYDRLDADQSRMLRLVALHPGRDLDGHAAAALVDATLAASDTMLTGLVQANLLRRHDTGRYTLHDLVRSFAVHRAHDEDPPSARRAATARLLDLYDASAARAAALFSPQLAFVVGDPPAPPTTPEPVLRDRGDAQRWLDAEWSNLVATAVHDEWEPRPAYVAHLSTYLQRYLDVTGRIPEAETLHGRAAGLTEGEARAQALVNLANVHFVVGRHPLAETLLRDALPLYRLAGNRAGESKALNNLGLVHQHAGRHEDARRHFEEALVLAPDALVELFPLGNLAKLSTRLGRLEDGLGYARRALVAAQSLGDPTREAQTLFTVGDQLRALARAEEALNPLEESLRLARAAHFPFCEAYALHGLALAHLELGDPGRAMVLHEEALAVARELGMTKVEIEVLNGVGGTLCRIGRPAEAAARHREALRAALRVGDRQQEAQAHEGIGDALAADGDPRAHEAWSLALTTYIELRLPDAERLAKRLEAEADRP